MKKRQVVVRTDGSRRNIGGSSIRNIRYVECQKNHAANIGGYAVDGCREFMASGEDGTTAALTCAACGCHRNFHRREVDGGEVVSECWFIMMIMFRPRLYEKGKVSLIFYVSESIIVVYYLWFELEYLCIIVVVQNWWIPAERIFLVTHARYIKYTYQKILYWSVWFCFFFLSCFLC